MNSIQSVSDKYLKELLSINTNKMNFQQSICHNIRNWAFGITGIFVPLIWKADIVNSLTIIIFLHIITIALIALCLHKDLSWHQYFYLFCDRARLTENTILEQKDIKTFVATYYEYLKPDEEELPPNYKNSPGKLLKKAINYKKFIRLKSDYIEIYLIIVLMVSLILKIKTFS